MAIRLVNENLIEPCAQVDLREILGRRQLIEQLIGARKRVPVLDRHRVECPEVGHCAVLPRRGCFWLVHVEVRSGELRLTLGDELFVQHFLQPLRLECRVLLVDARWHAGGWRGARRELDAQLVTSSQW